MPSAGPEKGTCRRLFSSLPRSGKPCPYTPREHSANVLNKQYKHTFFQKIFNMIKTNNEEEKQPYEPVVFRLVKMEIQSMLCGSVGGNPTEFIEENE